MSPLTSAPPIDAIESGYSLLVHNPRTFRQARLQQDYIGTHGLFLALIATLRDAAGLAWRHVAKEKLEELLPGERLTSLNAERRAGRFARARRRHCTRAMWLTKLVFIYVADSKSLDLRVFHLAYHHPRDAGGLAVLVLRAQNAFWALAVKGVASQGQASRPCCASSH
jgi:hypothetical protein